MSDEISNKELFKSKAVVSQLLKKMSAVPPYYMIKPKEHEELDVLNFDRYF